ncbi:double-strand break repair helicase AddA [Henriciella sp. AS95]|uniref:double-strand break repair helicase AddA n=1 Tax=Henriciella sp. AS95 TaxID=3135782 RepID=UPI00316BD0B6
MTDQPANAIELATRAQAEAALPDRSAWVEAHAGSGKTKVLIDRVARLLLRREDGRPGAAPDTILCITYTKAAANEMLTRLFERLGNWSVMKDNDLRRELAKLERRPEDDYSGDDLQAARALFARALETPGGLRIETIHAFCSRILRRFPLEADVSPGFGEIEDRDADRIWSDSLKDKVLRASEVDPDALVTLSEAGGGLGAGAVLSSLRWVRTKLTGREPGELAGDIKQALDAPDQTVEEILAEAMGSALPRASLQSALSGLNDLPKRGASDEKLFDTLDLVLQPYADGDRWEAWSGLFLTSSGDFRKSNPYTAGAAKLVPELEDLFQMKDGEGSEVARFRTIQTKLIARRAYERTLALITVGLPVLQAYEQGKTRRAALDFDDLIQHTKLLLTSTGVAEWVLFKLDGGLTHILLDEAQDTSPDQWVLINALVEEFRAGKGADRSTDPRTQFTVGDKKQSIYSFQGADPEQFLKEKRDFAAAEEALHGRANMPDMTVSFRSTQHVLDFVDAAFNQDSFAGDPFTESPPDEADVLKHAASRSGQEGRVDLWPIEPPTDDDDGDPWDAPLDHIAEKSPKNRLAEHVARAIDEMITAKEPVWYERKNEDGKRTWQQRPVRADDILILVRKRGALFESIIKALKKRKLPVAGADRLVLLDHIGVQDCLNLIRFALFPSDDLTLAEILRGPFCGLVDDDNDLFVLAHDRKREETLWDRLQTTPEPRFAAARDFCADLIAHRHLPAFDFLTHALTTRRENNLSGWDRLIQRLGEPARDPVSALISRSLGYDMGEAASLQSFLAEIEGDDSQLKRDLAEADGEIRVMTVHGAKGLQAPIVILPDTTSPEKADTNGLFMVDGKTPVYSPNKKEDPPILERLRLERKTAQARESRRLLYVALTRAQDRLIIGGAFAGRKTGAGYEPDSWYGLCRSAMLDLTDAPADTDETLTFGPILPPLTGADTADATPKTHAPDWAFRTPSTTATGPVVRAPSRLLTDTAPVSKPFGKARSAALKRGQLIHTLLQYLPEQPQDDRAAHARAWLARHTDLTPGEQDEILSVTLATLAHPDFADVFAPGGRSEAAIVGEIETASGKIIINGRADRLVITETDTLLIDYKTDRPAPASAEDIDASYLAQMAAYKMVLEAAWPGRRIRPALLYTDGPKLFELSETLLQSSRNRLAGGL